MNDRVQAVTLSDPEPTPDDTVATMLRATMDREGPALLFEPDALRLRLESALPEAAGRIGQVLAALDAQVPQALLGVHTGDELRAASLALEQRLVTTGGLDPDAATWAVATWAKALRVDACAVPSRPTRISRPAPSDVGMPAGGRSAIEAGFERSEPARPAAPKTSKAFAAGPVYPPPAARARSFTRPLNLAYGVVGVVAAAVIGFYANRYITESEGDEAPGADLLHSLPAPVAPGPSAAMHDAQQAASPARSSIEDTVVAGTPSIAGRSPGTVPSIVAAPPVGQAPAVPSAANASTSSASRTPRPSTVEDIAGLSDVPVGKPFDLIIAYRVGDREPASVERTVLERRGTRVVSTTPVSTLVRGADGALVYPFDAIARPARTTMEFVLVDADGVRSEPRRVVLDVVTPAAAQVAASACTRATCGSVVSTRPLGPPVDPGIGGRVAGAVGKIFGRETTPAARDAYEVTIRMDDRSVHTMTRLTPWKTGTRVRLVANRFVALDERAPKGRAARREGRLMPESALFVGP